MRAVASSARIQSRAGVDRRSAWREVAAGLALQPTESSRSSGLPNSVELLEPPAPMDQGGRAAAAMHGGDAADQNGVRMALQHLFDGAVDASERGAQQRRAGDQRRPLRARKSRGAMHAAASRKAVGEIFMGGGENIDAKRLARAKRGEGRGRSGDADDQRGRVERQ